MDSVRQRVARHVGVTLRDLEPLFTTEKAVSFDPVQMTFLQKLVRESALGKGVAVRKEDFFATIVYVDYWVEVIAGRPTLLSDLEVLVDELEKIDEYLDPDLVLVVRYSGHHASRDLKGEALLAPASREAILRRHARANASARPSPAGAAGAPLDAFHAAVGRMACDLVTSDAVLAALERVAGRGDLRAALAADAILRALPPADVGPEPLAALERGALGEAALLLVGALVRAGAGWSLRAHVDALRARR